MGALASARLLAVGATWRTAGLRSAGRALVEAADGDDETGRMLAGTLLVRAGDRSVPLVAEPLLAGRAGPALVDVLASIDTPRARAALTEVARGPSPECRAAAREALRTLDRIHGREE